MPIQTSLLRSTALRTPTGRPRTLTEAKVQGVRTAFLCHSHKDKEIVQGFVTLLSEQGFQAYIDWQDDQMPDKPNAETAKRIQRKITELDFFIFLATENSTRSRWCPWEIGYADAQKSRDSIFIAPTADNLYTYGNEYLEIYRRIDQKATGEIAVLNPGYSFFSTHLRDI